MSLIPTPSHYSDYSKCVASSTNVGIIREIVLAMIGAAKEWKGMFVTYLTLPKKPSDRVVLQIFPPQDTDLPSSIKLDVRLQLRYSKKKKRKILL